MRDRAFYDPTAFEWTRLFIEHFDEVAAEAERESMAMTPLYVQSVETVDGQPSKAKRWFARTLTFFSIRNHAVLNLMPVTSRLLEEVPGCTSAVLLTLEGNTHIKPHGGYTPDVLRCHLGISVPEPGECVLRVADEHRSWREREWLVFDDYLEHEVWHRGTQSRLVLLVDVIKPGVARTAREVAERLFRRAEGTRFDRDLEVLAPAATWLEWLDAGAFPAS